MNIFKSTIVLAALSAWATSVAADDLVYNWGPADTVAHHSVGPGMTYAKIVFPSKPLILWWVEIDLSNEHAKVEQVQSRHAVPDPLRWDVMTHYRENSRPGHQVKVAWNHDFFSYDPGVCIGLNISEGEVTWTPWGRCLLAITEDKKAEVFRHDLDAHLTAPDGTVVAIDYYNALNGGVYGDCVLYNRFNSKQLTEEGRYVALHPIDPWIVNGCDIRLEVMEVSDRPIQTAQGVYVLYLTGSKLNALDGHLAPGDVVKVTQSFRTPAWGVAPARVLNAFHGYPSIVHDGVLHDGEYNNFENGREHEKSSRVMAGVSRDKTRLYVATTELSGSSVGVDCIELAAWMVEKGAYDVVNFDSGGSAAIVIDEKMLNLPGRGAVRPVQDAMLAVSTALEDAVVDHIAFSRPCISPSIVSRTPLRVMAFNRYDEPLSDDVGECVYRCDPPELGRVDDSGVFHASAQPMSGRVIAEKDGKTAAITVCTQPLEKIYPVRQSVLIDNLRRVPIELEGVSDGLTRVVDPGAFDWSAVPAGIIEVDDDGVLSGIANGKVALTGELGDIKMTIDVTVEISDGDIIHPVFNDMEAVKFQKPAAVKNAVIDYAALPDGWERGAVVNFDLAANRSANITFSPDLTFYSLPKAITMRMYDKTGVANKITMQFIDGAGGRQNIVADASAGDNEYTFSFNDSEGAPYPYYLYPLRLNRVMVGLKTTATPGASLGFESIRALYPASSGVRQVSAGASASPFDVKVDGETLIVAVNRSKGGRSTLRVYDVAGRVRAVAVADLAAGENRVDVDIKSLPVGIYAAVLDGDGVPQSSVKFMVR